MSLPEADALRARTNSGSCSDHEITPTAYGENRCEIPLAYDDHHLRPEWSSNVNDFGARDPTYTSSGSALLIPPLSFGNSSYELSAHPAATLPPSTWDPLLDTNFPNSLEQMNLGIPISEDFLRPQFDFLNTSRQPELLSYAHSQPVMVSSPSRYLLETDSLLPFENGSHTGATYHQASTLNPSFLSKTMESREIPPFMPFHQEVSCGITSCSSGSQPLPILSSPLGIGFFTPEISRTTPSLGLKRSLPTMTRGGNVPNAHEVKESLLGFEGRGGSGSSHGFNVAPSTASKYPFDGFHDTITGEGSSQLAWDMCTRSSSPLSPSCEQSSSDPAKYPDGCTSDYLGSSSLLPSLPSGFPPSKVPTHGSSLGLEKNATLGSKQNTSQVPGNRDYPANQKRIGSLIDIHHLTNHVPRRRLTVEQEQILLRRFAVQEYLSKREMEELAEKLKIPTSQLRTWFGNRRSKLKAAARQKAKMEAGIGHLTDAELRSLNKRS
ncbi:hypothetical protein PCANC_07451 [Puccinia coronata f. sp. avenae]|uniref:Homeobox domain-containing protein n=1 Tax=Puccinia coronata f. sp. avenae TaxID=200324 RepID=A0A2N5T458_9BASI|nr:hypothetical protein PCANC_07451 [Puccinia coronata f. sp. avenae]